MTVNYERDQESRSELTLTDHLLIVVICDPVDNVNGLRDFIARNTGKIIDLHKNSPFPYICPRVLFYDRFASPSNYFDGKTEVVDKNISLQRP